MQSSSNNSATPTPPTNRRPRSGASAYRFLMGAALLGTLGYCGYATYSTMQANAANKTAAAEGGTAAAGLIEPTIKHLAPGFTDSTGTLLADTPKNPAELIDPSSIVVAHLDDSESDAPEVDWKNLEASLSKAVGRPVGDLVYDSSQEQLSRCKNGSITLVALHPADAPFLVNNVGYHPLAVLAEDGKASGNRLDLIVPAGSPINRPADLKGRVLTCTVPSSITGYRAAIAVLARDQSLRPLADYEVTWSLKQSASINGVAEGRYQAAAVSDVKLESMKASHKIKPDSYKLIYQSDVVPETTIGCFCNLKPELAGKLRQAILDYVPPVDADGETGMKFIPTDYKKDFAFIRAIDDRFDPRLNVKIKKSAAVTTAPGN